MRAALRLERTRWLDSLLVVIAVSLSVAVLIVAGSMMVSNELRIARFSDSLDARLLEVSSGATDEWAYAGGADLRRLGSIYTAQPRFTLEDVSAALQAAPTVDYWYQTSYQTSIDTEAWDGAIPVFRATADYLEAARIRVVAGTSPTPSDFDELRPVILITQRFASALQIEGDPIGQDVYFVGEPEPYTVIGIMPSRDDQPISIREALAPMEPSNTMSEMTFAVDNADDLQQAAAELREFAKDRWGDAASVVTHSNITARYLSDQRQRDLVVMILATATLLVAATNVMGLLLARAARDEFRIGLARTLGASAATVRRRMLLDASALGIVGGLTGVAASFALLRAYNANLAQDTGNFQIQFAISPPIAAIGLGLAILLCLAAAAYPVHAAGRTSIVSAIGGA